MANYEVSSKGNPNTRIRVEADNPKQAIDNFSKISGNPPSSEIVVRMIDEDTHHSEHESSPSNESFESLEVSVHRLQKNVEELTHTVKHIRLMFAIACFATIVVPYFVYRLN